MGKYPVMVKVTVCAEYTDWDEWDEYCLIYADNLEEAAKIIEGYYGTDYVKVDFNFFAEEGTLVIFPKEMAHEIEAMPR